MLIYKSLELSEFLKIRGLRRGERGWATKQSLLLQVDAYDVFPASQ